jgi:hypothetical protein
LHDCHVNVSKLRVELSASSKSYLGEQGCPDRLDILYIRRLQESLELVGLERREIGCVSPPVFRDLRICNKLPTHRDIDTIVSQDQGRVGNSELCGRHCNLCICGTMHERRRKGGWVLGIFLCFDVEVECVLLISCVQSFVRASFWSRLIMLLSLTSWSVR